MCGITGYVGHRPARDLLLDGLTRLEYRGYDSAGISLADGENLTRTRAVGALSALRAALASEATASKLGGGVLIALKEPTTGIGHTRWATHGQVTHENAHPHADGSERIQIVLNGIVENYLELRLRLEEKGVGFVSETDAEVVAHLVASHYQGDLLEAVLATYRDLRGHYAFVVLAADTPGGVEVVDTEGRALEIETRCVDWEDEIVEKRGYPTYMLKEIHEQPVAVAQTLAEQQLESADAGLDLLSQGFRVPEGTERVVLLACGTSYHAGLVARYAIERWARIPVEIEIASEYRDREPLLQPNALVIGISQSGETADTLAAMRMARAQGGSVAAVTNVMGSEITREADQVFYTRAGLEIGVAATKTFTAQVAALMALALKLAVSRDALSPPELGTILKHFERIPSDIGRAIEMSQDQVGRVAERFSEAGFFLYLGRGNGLPVALEGALKLKEVSYIPADAYAAGEMKHGPIALLDARTPVICIATDSPVLNKMMANMSEVRARGARIVAIASEGSKAVAEHAEEILYVPKTDPLLQPLLAVIPLQLLAHEIALSHGLNVDQPRNLAKTVTVE
ncbi:MAG: glutamine--fructose-6-phosphate transaminase (isomerizing) [Actinobacteria bacterium]|nr:glutamine--fructose-6-phosphate transaminase (isomerizing) [Actinomycetota bacterium]